MHNMLQTCDCSIDRRFSCKLLDFFKLHKVELAVGLMYYCEQFNVLQVVNLNKLECPCSTPGRLSLLAESIITQPGSVLRRDPSNSKVGA